MAGKSSQKTELELEEPQKRLQGEAVCRLSFQAAGRPVNAEPHKSNYSQLWQNASRRGDMQKKK